MITLYGIRSCDNCRKARRWLQDRDIEFRFTDIRDEVLEEPLLERWQKQCKVVVSYEYFRCLKNTQEDS